MQNFITFVTGPPCSGKSLLMEGFVKKSKEQGMSIESIDDYKFYSEWAGDEKNGNFFKPFGDSYKLDREAYPFIAAFSAERVANEMMSYLENGKDVVAIEAARGAFGEDSYNEHLLKQVLEILGDKRSDVGFVNFEVDGGSVIELESRIAVRFAEHPDTAPPGTAAKYFNTEGNLLTSSLDELSKAGLGDQLLLNEIIHNHVGLEGVNELVEGMRRRFLEASAPYRDFESQRSIMMERRL
jgi:hypothetical protein